jgi:pimeloyl-ACP methyl ester carboxylesterase
MPSGLNIKREISLEINNMTMSAVVYGNENKTPILALHGWLDNAASFEILAKRLTDSHIIAIDFFGHGKSSHRPKQSPYYLWDNISDIYVLLQVLNISKIDLLGHSMGAAVAMLFAASFPEKVGKLLLIEGLAPFNYPETELPALMAQAIRYRARFFTKKITNHSSLQTLIEARMHSRFPVSQEAAELLVTRGTNIVENKVTWRSDPALRLPSISRMSQGQIEAFLKSVTAQVYMFLGRDGLANDEWQAYFNCLQNLTLCWCDGNHHLHMQQAGADFIAFEINKMYKKQGF